MLAKTQVYGAPWCPDCKRSKQFLGEQRLEYEWIDIDKEPALLMVRQYLQQLGDVPEKVAAA